MTNIAVSSDEHYCIGIENGNAVVLIDLVSNETLFHVTADHTEITSIEFSPDGERFLALCGDGKFVQVWNTKAEMNVKHVQRDMMMTLLMEKQIFLIVR